MDKMVKIVIGFITAIPTATGVNIFDAAIKVSLSISVNITYHLDFYVFWKSYLYWFFFSYLWISFLIPVHLGKIE